MGKLEVLSAIKFGERVAEEEGDELTRYFVETDNWKRLYDGDIDIVYGPKGSGKSALYALLLARQSALFDRGIVLAAAENPRGAPAFKDLVADPPTSEREFVGLWKLYFLSLVSGVFEEYGVTGASATELRTALEREGLVQSGWSLLNTVRAVRDYVRRALRPRSAEGGILFDPSTGLPVGFTGKITFEEPAPSEAHNGFVSVDHLLAAADNALMNAGSTIWLVLDRLDVAFADSLELEANALRALFRAYLDMQGHKNLKLKVFLRTDIWRRITTAGFREASHITRHMTISWDPGTLLNLVVRRAIQNTPLQDHYQTDESEVLASAALQEQFFYRMCPPQVEVGGNKPATFDWMLGRTCDATRQTAPRELIHFLNCLRDVQVRRLEIGDPEPEGEQLFARSSFKEALPEVSRVRLEQTLFAEYPQLRDSLEALRGAKTLQTATTLASVWRCDQQQSAKTARQLAEIGFFEQRGSKEAPQYWVPFLFRDGLEMVQGTAGTDAADASSD